jgi:hypothetical protein
VAHIYQNRVVQPVRAFTGLAAFDGLLTLSLGQRTLDELNLADRPLLVLEEPVVHSGRAGLVEGTLAVSKSAILFTVEIDAVGADLHGGTPEPEAEPKQAFRSLLRLRIGEYTLEGYMHMPPGISFINRMSQARRRFVALTSASIDGPGVSGVAHFVAANWAHVLSAQEVLSIESISEDPGVEAIPEDAGAEAGAEAR